MCLSPILLTEFSNSVDYFTLDKLFKKNKQAMRAFGTEVITWTQNLKGLGAIILL